MRIDLHFLNALAPGECGGYSPHKIAPSAFSLNKHKAAELRSAAGRDPKNSQNSKILMMLPHTRLAHYFDFFLVPFFFFVAMISSLVCALWRG